MVHHYILAAGKPSCCFDTPSRAVESAEQRNDDLYLLQYVQMVRPTRITNSVAAKARRIGQQPSPSSAASTHAPHCRGTSHWGGAVKFIAQEALRGRLRQQNITSLISCPVAVRADLARLSTCAGTSHSVSSTAGHPGGSSGSSAALGPRLGGRARRTRTWSSRILGPPLQQYVQTNSARSCLPAYVYL